MRFKSKAQQGWMFAAQARGEVPKGTAERWARNTKSIAALPEHSARKDAAKQAIKNRMKGGRC